MKRAIRKHLRDFVAIIFLVVVGRGVAGYILSNQRFYLPAWVPVVGTDFYELEGRAVQTAQAVVPGQGQTVNIAGVKVGDIGAVRLEDGRAVVEMKIRRKHAPMYKDATILLRPKTGLKDMYLELDPGTESAGELEEGDRIPVANTLPDVNPDEILASARRRHARLPAGAAQLGRRGAGRRRARRAARDLQALRAARARQRKVTRLLIAAPPATSRA